MRNTFTFWYLGLSCLIFGCAGPSPRYKVNGFHVDRLRGEFPLRKVKYWPREKLRNDIQKANKPDIEKEVDLKLVPSGGILEIGSSEISFNRVKIVNDSGMGLFNCLEVDFESKVATKGVAVNQLAAAYYVEKETFQMRCEIKNEIGNAFRIRMINEMDREIGEFRISKIDSAQPKP